MRNWRLCWARSARSETDLPTFDNWSGDDRRWVSVRRNVALSRKSELVFCLCFLSGKKIIFLRVRLWKTDLLADFRDYQCRLPLWMTVPTGTSESGRRGRGRRELVSSVFAVSAFRSFLCRKWFKALVDTILLRRRHFSVASVSPAGPIAILFLSKVTAPSAGSGPDLSSHHL